MLSNAKHVCTHHQDNKLFNFNLSINIIDSVLSPIVIYQRRRG